ncbi:SLOG cluster 4 domain-containing protein [Nocardia sp. X0981]
MAAVAAGAATAGGLVIGVRPDTDRSAVRAGLSAVVYTDMGEARNNILICSADAVIVIRHPPSRRAGPPASSDTGYRECSAGSTRVSTPRRNR